MRTAMKRILYVFLSLVVLAGVALAVRQWLAPEAVPPPRVELTPDQEARLREVVTSSLVTQTSILERLRDADVALVGEVHFYRETMQYLTALLESVDGRRVSLLLEMPAATQGAIDSFLESKDESVLDSVFADRSVLPYRDILVWAADHRDKVPVVVAMDENRTRIVMNRAFLRDTRNETMAQRVLEERRRNPEHVVVAYGGQLHFTMAGRYLYDVENRVPMGARLVQHGIERRRIVTIMLSGHGASPLCDVMDESGVMSTSGALGREPYPLFVAGKIFRADTAAELFDYFVNLGPLTPTSP